jgi:hypothetical protein
MSIWLFFILVYEFKLFRKIKILLMQEMKVWIKCVFLDK